MIKLQKTQITICGVSEFPSWGFNFTDLAHSPQLSCLSLSSQPRHLFPSYSLLSLQLVLWLLAVLLVWRSRRQLIWSASLGFSIMKTLNLCTAGSLTSANPTCTRCKLWLLVIRTHKEGSALGLCLTSSFHPAAGWWQSDLGGKACLGKVNHFS